MKIKKGNRTQIINKKIHLMEVLAALKPSPVPKEKQRFFSPLP